MNESLAHTPSLVHYFPIGTTLFSAFFAWQLFRHFAEKPGALYLLWWGFGVVTYGLGTIVESSITLFGWQEWLFRAWYITGALLGGAPLAQGTVYFLFSRKTANILSAVLISAILFGSVTVLLTPLNYELVKPHVPQGDIIIWKWVRWISPFINTYAVLFLIGGAVTSAIRYRRMEGYANRAVGNTLIAIGAILPGIGGAMSRAGYTEVLYIGEFIGIILIYLGYKRCMRDKIHNELERVRPVTASR